MEGIPEFQGSAGCTRDTTNMAPYDFFSMLVEDSILEEIVKQTNLFAEQFLEGEIDFRLQIQGNRKLIPCSRTF